LFAAQISQNGPKNAWDSHDSLTTAKNNANSYHSIALFAKGTIMNQIQFSTFPLLSKECT